MIANRLRTTATAKNNIDGTVWAKCGASFSGSGCAASPHLVLPEIVSDAPAFPQSLQLSAEAFQCTLQRGFKSCGVSNTSLCEVLRAAAFAARYAQAVAQQGVHIHGQPGRLRKNHVAASMCPQEGLYFWHGRQLRGQQAQIVRASVFK